MDNQATQSERENSWLTEGILIASVPVYAYILLLSFVIGYCEFFDIPVSFVSLNLPTMLWIGLQLKNGLFFLFIFAVVVYWCLKVQNVKISKAVLLLYIPYVGLLLLQIMQGLPWRDWRWTLLILMIFIPAAFFLQ